MDTANTFEPDPCCTEHLSLALFEGALENASVWTCPACGCDWRAEMRDGIKHWSPKPIVAIFR